MLAQFVQVKRDIERQKLAAEVTIKLRALYYNRIDPSRVESTSMAVAPSRARGEGDIVWHSRPNARNYYDGVSVLADVVQDIYNHVPRLEDIKFLIHFCTRLFAEELDSISGEAIMQAIIVRRGHTSRCNPWCL